MRISGVLLCEYMGGFYTLYIKFILVLVLGYLGDMFICLLSTTKRAIFHHHQCLDIPVEIQEDVADGVHLLAVVLPDTHDHLQEAERVQVLHAIE